MDFVINYNVLVKYTGRDSDVVIPNRVTSIGCGAFSGCRSLTSVTIPDSVTRIGRDAFSHCSGLTSITIPERVTSISGDAFESCDNLISISVATGNKYFDSRDNCNAVIDSQSNELIIGCKNTVIPDGVTKIGDSAFSGCNSLTSITIPDSVYSIGNCAFYGCSSLTNITITDVISIGYGAFFGCSSLTSITISESVTSIYTYPFGDKSAFDANIKVKFKKKENVLFAIYVDCLKKQIVELINQDKYDEVFKKIKTISGKILFIFGRLKNPINLSEETLEEYKVYLKKQGLKAVKLFVDDNDREMINWILELDCLSKASLQKAIDYSNENKKTEITAMLLDYQNKHFPPKKTVKKLSL